MLLYADDTVVFGTDENDFHNNSDMFYEYSELWHSTPRGGGSLIVSYIHRLGSFWGVQNFEFQNVLWFSEKLILLGVSRICENSLEVVAELD